jgi:hypothetical protein
MIRDLNDAFFATLSEYLENSGRIGNNFNIFSCV